MLDQKLHDLHQARKWAEACKREYDAVLAANPQFVTLMEQKTEANKRVKELENDVRAQALGTPFADLPMALGVRKGKYLYDEMAMIEYAIQFNHTDLLMIDDKIAQKLCRDANSNVDHHVPIEREEIITIARDLSPFLTEED